MGRGTMTVLHDANVEGSDPVLNGVYAGGFESLVEATRKVCFPATYVRHDPNFTMVPFMFGIRSTFV